MPKIVLSDQELSELDYAIAATIGYGDGSDEDDLMVFLLKYFAIERVPGTCSTWSTTLRHAPCESVHAADLG